MQLCHEQNVTLPLPRLILHDKLAVFCCDLASASETIPTIPMHGLPNLCSLHPKT